MARPEIAQPWSIVTSWCPVRAISSQARLRVRTRSAYVEPKPDASLGDGDAYTLDPFGPDLGQAQPTCSRELGPRRARRLRPLITSRLPTHRANCLSCRREPSRTCGTR